MSHEGVEKELSIFTFFYAFLLRDHGRWDGPCHPMWCGMLAAFLTIDISESAPHVYAPHNHAPHISNGICSSGQGRRAARLDFSWNSSAWLHGRILPQRVFAQASGCGTGWGRVVCAEMRELSPGE
jgi:hypothetical protein